jgi:hypothetical protein
MTRPERLERLHSAQTGGDGPYTRMRSKTPQEDLLAALKAEAEEDEVPDEH